MDEQQLQYMFELTEENLKMPVWTYNDKCYYKNNDNKLLNTELIYHMKFPNAEFSYLVLQKYMPYIMDLTFHKYEFEQIKNILKYMQFLKSI